MKRYRKCVRRDRVLPAGVLPDVSRDSPGDQFKLGGWSPGETRGSISGCEEENNDDDLAASIMRIHLTTFSVAIKLKLIDVHNPLIWEDYIYG